MVQGRLDAEVSATADQRATADQQLGEDRNRIGLRVRGDLGDDLSGQPVKRLLAGGAGQPAGAGNVMPAGWPVAGSDGALSGSNSEITSPVTRQRSR